MSRRHLSVLACFMFVLAVASASYAIYVWRHHIADAANGAGTYAMAQRDMLEKGLSAKWLQAGAAMSTAWDDGLESVHDTYDAALSHTAEKANIATRSVTAAVNSGTGAVLSVFDALLNVNVDDDEDIDAATWARSYRSAQIVDASYNGAMPHPRTLSAIKEQQNAHAADYNAIAPAAGTPVWTPETPSVTAEAVLVPRQVTVISSSQDGRIAEIPVGHGDTFKKGDLLIAYDCTDIEAEAEIARVQNDLTKKKAQGTDELFKLDIISDLDRLGAQVENKQAQAKARAFAAQMEDCRIRARFDGRVTNRLANPGEYTRTDRVLLEVASNEPLQAEFLMPSKWLRWVNIGAPVQITIGETEHTYTARVTGIHGEVDPVSQSIQMVATLDDYTDPLLPGMSGQAVIDAAAIRNAGIKGYLEAGHAPPR